MWIRSLGRGDLLEEGMTIHALEMDMTKVTQHARIWYVLLAQLYDKLLAVISQETHAPEVRYYLCLTKLLNSYSKVT